MNLICSYVNGLIRSTGGLKRKYKERIERERGREKGDDSKP